MANLIETPDYTTGIFQLELTTPVKGGAPVIVSGTPTDGFSNAQAQQLANRTAYLKQQTDSIPTQISSAITNLKAESDPFPQYVLDTLVGVPSGICGLDSSGKVATSNLPALGEVNTASNLGTGEGVFGTKNGVDLQFKSLKVVNNLAISSTASEITIDGTHTHASTAITDFSEAVDDRVAGLLQPGANITLTYDDTANTLTIAATGSGGTSGVNVSDEGTAVALATTLNFTGTGVTATNAGSGVVNVDIPGGSSGTGDVVGPASSVDSEVVLFNGTTGKLIKGGGTLGTAAFTASTAYATAVQGSLADSALQPSDIGSSVQAQLVSGTNIKTVNGTSLLGSGDIVISGGGAVIDGSNTSNFTASSNTTYWLRSSLTVTLPDTTTPPTIGTFVRFLKTHSATPVIQVGGGSAVIQTTSGSDTSVTYNVNSEIVFVFNGTDWEI